MLYIKQAVFTPRTSVDRDILPKFLLSLTENSMYRPIVDEIGARPGFVRRELYIIDDASGTKAINKIIFSSQESFAVYLAHEGTQMIWEYLAIMADSEGIDFETSELVIEE
jgi:hypothetical protein